MSAHHILGLKSVPRAVSYTHLWKPFGHKFEWTHHAQDIADQVEELTANETVVRLSGRVMAK